MSSLIEVHVADARLARAVRRAIDSAVRDAWRATPAIDLPVVRLRTQKRLAALLADGTRLRDAIAIVHLTAANARRLPAMITALRAAGVAGVQVVWDGREPPRARVERHVFAVLEEARRSPTRPPVVLSSSEEPEASLRLLIASRNRGKDPSSK